MSGVKSTQYPRQSNFRFRQQISSCLLHLWSRKCLSGDLSPETGSRWSVPAKSMLPLSLESYADTVYSDLHKSLFQKTTTPPFFTSIVKQTLFHPTVLCNSGLNNHTNHDESPLISTLAFCFHTQLPLSIRHASSRVKSLHRNITSFTRSYFEK